MSSLEKYLTEASYKNSKDWVLDALNGTKQFIDIAINGVKKVSTQTREKSDINAIKGAKHQIKLAQEELKRADKKLSQI